MCRLLRKDSSREGGATAVLTVIVSVVLLGSVSFAIDMGNAMQTQRKSQSAADSAAFAGVQTFDAEISKPDPTLDSTLDPAVATALWEQQIDAKRNSAINKALLEASFTAKRNFPGLNFDEAIPGERCGDVPDGYLTNPALSSNCFSIFTGSQGVPARVRVVLPARTKALFGQAIGANTISAEATATITGIEAGQNLSPTDDEDAPTDTSTTTTIAAGGGTTTTIAAGSGGTTTTIAAGSGGTTTTIAAGSGGTTTTIAASGGGTTTTIAASGGGTTTTIAASGGGTTTTIAASGGGTTTTIAAGSGGTTTTIAAGSGGTTTTIAAGSGGTTTTTTRAATTTTTAAPVVTTTAVPVPTTVPVSTVGPCSPGNLLTNGGFESGFTGWSGTNSPAVGSSYAREGTRVAWVHSVGSIFQTVSAVPGQEYETTFFGGTHDPTNNAQVAMEFLNSSGAVLSSSALPMDTDVDIAPGLVGGPFRWRLTAPAGTVNVRVKASVTDKDWVKLDGVSIIGCAAVPVTTTTPPTTTTSTTTTTTTAPAGIPSRCAICVMAPSGTTATNSGSTSQMTAIGGDIYIHSPSPSALLVNGGFVLTTPSGMFTNIVGGVTWHGGSAPSTLRTGQPTRTDPLAYVSVPTPDPSWPARSTPGLIRSNTTISSGIYNSAIGWSGATLTLNPGVYNGLSAGGASGTRLVMNAGQYIFTGPVSLNGLAQFTTGNSGTDGVSMYFTCKSASSGSPAPCTPSNVSVGGQLDTGGTSDLRLKPPTSGSQRGISIFYDRNNTNPVRMRGNSTFNVGAVYALKSTAEFGGTTAMISSSSLVIGLLNLVGTGQIQATYDTSKLP
jgi:hypothetical protein